MEFRYTCRSLDDATKKYEVCDGKPLSVREELVEGDGSAARPFQYAIYVSNNADAAWSGVVHIELVLRDKHPRFLLPGFMYGWNRGEVPVDGRDYPRLSPWAEGKPLSTWWMESADRLAYPCALAYDDGAVRGLAGRPVTELGMSGFTCAFGASVGYTLGYEEAPWVFVAADDMRDREPLGAANVITIGVGQTVCVKVDVFDYAADCERGYADALETVYWRYRQPCRAVGGVEEAIRDLSAAVRDYAWLPDKHMYAGFVFDDMGEEKNTVRDLGSISWTNGLSVAVPMLQAALGRSDDVLRAQALDCIQHIVDCSMNPDSGLPYDAVNDNEWLLRGWWASCLPEPGHSSYLVGQALYYILQAYEAEQRACGATHDDWLAFVSRVISVLEASKNGDGEYPYVFSGQSGDGLDYNSFAGAWCMAAVAYYDVVTGTREHLASLLASQEWYRKAYIDRMECYGAPLDVKKAVDSEGVLAYIKAMRRLHEMTGEDRMLTYLRHALDYEFSFTFCWNTPVSTPPLSTVGWTSCGGGVTSVCNPHIHPMSSNVIGDMLYYLQHRQDDDYVRARVDDMIAWSCQTYNRYDREYDYGRRGWMSERFCYSRGLLHERYPDGSAASTWFALMPWAVGAIVDGLNAVFSGSSLGDYRRHK